MHNGGHASPMLGGGETVSDSTTEPLVNKGFKPKGISSEEESQPMRIQIT